MLSDREKRVVLVLATASLVGLVFLAPALDGFTFLAPYAPQNLSGGDHPDPSSANALTRIMVLVVFCLLPIVILAVLMVARRRRRLLLLLPIGFLMLYLMTVSQPVEQQLELAPVVEEAVPTVEGSLLTPQPTPPLADTGAPQVTSGLIWLLSLAMAGLLVGTVALIWLMWRNFRGGHVSPLQAIADSAETALQALEQGADWQSTVLGCYQSMLAAAEQSRGVERPEHMTPAEFILRLVQAGLPQAPVERLTHLFEKARYSPQSPSAAMEAEAIACLQDVVTAAKGEA